MRPRYWHVMLGFNYRMTGLQAAVGIAQLRKIDRLLGRKRRVAIIYEEVLGSIHGITLHPRMSWATPSYWLYSILVDDKVCGLSRDKLMKELERRGIETRRLFYPLHQMPIFREYVSERDKYLVSTFLSEHGLNLPSGPRIDDEEVEYVASAVKNICRLV